MTMTDDVRHRLIDANGIRIHLAERGEPGRPVVLLCHGFPESWYSWRHQLEALAAAGYHAVAPDMRGYGQTDAPAEVERYTMLHLVGDMVGVLDALDAPAAVIVGHDWGAPVAWNAALLRPDRFPAVAALSVPFRGRGPVRPSTALPQTAEAQHYMLYFQAPGVAEAELDREPRRALRAVLFSASGDRPPRPPGDDLVGMVPRNAGFLSRMIEPAVLPPWLSEADLDFYAAELARTGFRGGLSWYRAMDRSWELMAPFAGAPITVPALFMAGDRDLVMMAPGMDQVLANLPRVIPRLHRVTVLPGCGHWTQQERPAEVNAALLEFLGSAAPPSARART
jgi:pimeloyl-ACP methyl ester carboxylesterase